MSAHPSLPTALSAGPGLAKTRGLPLIVTRTALLARGTDARFRALFELADVVSEGATRRESTAQPPAWYGSTSLILPLPALTQAEQSFVLRIATHDLHIRVRALRIATREAALRAPWPLGTATCEVQFQFVAAGLRIDVDLQAPLIEQRSGLAQSDV